MVPVLSEEGMPPVCESLVCVEYVDELAALHGGASSLLPGSPAERAALRVKVDWINRNLCSPFYQVLVRTSMEDRQAALTLLNSSLDELEAWIY